MSCDSGAAAGRTARPRRPPPHHVGPACVAFRRILLASSCARADAQLECTAEEHSPAGTGIPPVRCSAAQQAQARAAVAAKRPYLAAALGHPAQSGSGKHAPALPCQDWPRRAPHLQACMSEGASYLSARWNICCGGGGRGGGGWGKGRGSGARLGPATTSRWGRPTRQPMPACTAAGAGPRPGPRLQRRLRVDGDGAVVQDVQEQGPHLVVPLSHRQLGRTGWQGREGGMLRGGASSRRRAGSSASPAPPRPAAPP